MNRTLTSLFTVTVGLASFAGAVSGSDPVVKRPEELSWMRRSSGVEVAVLQGDPAKPGPFTLRLRYPAGYRKGPHYHPGDAYVTVLSGGYFRGYGSVEVESEAFELTPGTFSVNPGGVSHYEWTTGPAELQVHATGPWETVYVDAEGRPTGAREMGMENDPTPADRR